MSELINQILEQIQKESKKNPLTDLELSKLLNCERAYVTKVRKKYKVPSRNERYKRYLMESLHESRSSNEPLNEDQMIKLLNEKGYTLTRYMSKELLKDFIKDKSKRAGNPQIIEKEGFEELIGIDESLKNAVRLAKSSIVFPGKGLPTLLIGERGVGKWTIAKLMYLYGKSVGKFLETMEFQEIHCADYSEQFDELKKLLENYLMKSARESNHRQPQFLLLEEVDMIPTSCKDVLLGYLEEYNNTANDGLEQVFLVGTTIKSYDQSQENRLLSSFPIKIPIPNLENRSIEERLELVTAYLKKQSLKLDKSIVISKDALTAFLLYQPKGNIKGLHMDLQMSLARSFTSGLVLKNNDLYVDLESVGEEVKEGFLRGNAYRETTHRMIPAQGLRIDRKMEANTKKSKGEAFTINNPFLIHYESEKNQDKNFSYEETEPALSVPQIGILVITHGNYGLKMVEMALQLMGSIHAKIKTIEMPLEKEIDDIYDESVEWVKELDQGKGVLIMVDMGSLNALTHMITQETGVPIVGVDRIDILLLMEAIRLCSRPGMTLPELRRLLTDLKNGNFVGPEYRKQGFPIKKMIITTCITGEGSAMFLKQQLEKSLKNLDVEILAMGVFSTQGLFEKVVQLKKTYDILFITGTVDPKVPDIEFIFFDEVMKKETIEKMKRKYVSFKSKDPLLKIDRNILFVNKKFKEKMDVVTFLCNKVVEQGYTNKRYLDSVLERMALAPLNMLDGSEKGIVVIHTASFDDVLKTGLAVLTLEEPIFWDQIWVDVIFVLLVKDSSIQIPMEFHTSIVTNETVMTNIRTARNKNELYELLFHRETT